MLITFEGIDGAGKSTQINELVHHLANQGIEFVTLREPGGTPVAEKIRRILLESSHEISPIGELLLFSASRAELVKEVIVPALAAVKPSFWTGFMIQRQPIRGMAEASTWRCSAPLLRFQPAV